MSTIDKLTWTDDDNQFISGQSFQLVLDEILQDADRPAFHIAKLLVEADFPHHKDTDPDLEDTFLESLNVITDDLKQGFQDGALRNHFQFLLASAQGIAAIMTGLANSHPGLDVDTFLADLSTNEKEALDLIGVANSALYYYFHNTVSNRPQDWEQCL